MNSLANIRWCLLSPISLPFLRYFKNKFCLHCAVFKDFISYNTGILTRDVFQLDHLYNLLVTSLPPFLLSDIPVPGTISPISSPSRFRLLIRFIACTVPVLKRSLFIIGIHRKHVKKTLNMLGVIGISMISFRNEDPDLVGSGTFRTSGSGIYHYMDPFLPLWRYDL